MKKIRTIIVDDEPHAIEIIQKYAAEFSELEVIACCHSALQAFRVMQEESIDLIFLDVKMPVLVVLILSKVCQVHRGLYSQRLIRSLPLMALI
ncbi:LytR/AlgR family response regulator transcription factor [Chitinophaga pinensis]|uniref:LytR/AlgR family response regulator transcription factor n=1 Tax=Chitinophaga pinensis TaxID=79329 RepID=UPI001C990230|nr:response regulator [Chitinophaga pinensis]